MEGDDEVLAGQRQVGRLRRLEEGEVRIGPEHMRNVCASFVSFRQAPLKGVKTKETRLTGCAEC